MKLIKISLAIILVYTAPMPVLAADAWTESICKQNSKQSCVAAYGWHWLRKAQVIVDPAITTMQYSGLTWVMAHGARLALGETPEVVFLLTVSRSGVQAGTFVLIGGLVMTVAGAFSSAAGFLLAGTTPTAAPELDEFLLMCRHRLEPFHSPDGVQRLSQLTPLEMEQLLPCIPQDKELFSFLSETASFGNQIHRP